LCRGARSKPACDARGSIIYITPRLLFDAGGGWVLRASAQLPVSDSSLNGNQHEKTVVNVGVTRLFERQGRNA
jgi:hypothetical protein